MLRITFHIRNSAGFSWLPELATKMFKKFVPKEDISGQNLTKTSVQRGIRSKIIEQYPAIEPYSDIVLPKKSNIIVVKCRDHINLISVENEIIFFQHYEGPYYPTLKILHQYPFILPQVQVDRGAIKFVLSGANIMCPGLTSPGGKLPDGIAKDTIVAIMAEGKQHALAIGKTLMTSEEMKSTNKGHGIENIHSLGDGLWKYIPEKPE